MPATTPYAAAYLRRSAATENNPGLDSRDAQEAAVRRLCGDDVQLFIDWGISGSGAKTEKRAEYLRLKAAIAADEVSSVCAYSLSRLGRSVRELVAFMELCRDHKVTVRTATESVDTSSAFGRAMFQIMGVFAELELETGKERTASARLARRARHESADALLPGGGLPNSVPAYGYVHVKGADGIIRREPDPEHPIEPILDAYREAGSITGAAVLLNERGIPSPRTARTGKPALWGSSTLARVLRAHDATLLPERSATGRQRPLGKPAVFRGLLRCHCGGLMTVNTERHQYRCSRGSNRQGVATHGRATISERQLKLALQSEVARAYRPVRALRAKRQEQTIAELQARRERVAAAMLDGLISASKAKAETEAIDAKLDRLEREQGAIVGVGMDRSIDLNNPNPAKVNEQLRRIWLRVDLDKGYNPHPVWVVDPDELRAADERDFDMTEIPGTGLTFKTTRTGAGAPRESSDR